MKNQQIAICQKIQKFKHMFLIECKIGHATELIGIPQGDDDYAIAQTLKPGDRFILETRDKTLHPIPHEFEIPEGVYQLPYIIKKIPTK